MNDRKILVFVLKCFRCGLKSKISSLDMRFTCDSQLNSTTSPYTA